MYNHTDPLLLRRDGEGKWGMGVREMSRGDEYWVCIVGAYGIGVHGSGCGFVHSSVWCCRKCNAMVIVICCNSWHCSTTKSKLTAGIFRIRYL